jgi:small-conductance mechanosensitive channel
MNPLLQTLEAWTGLAPETLNKILASVAAILLLWTLTWLIQVAVGRRTEDVRVRYQWKKATTYVVVLLGMVVLLRIWVAGLQDLATYIGLVSAGLAIALKDLLVNLAGWLFILWRRPMEVGDRIEIGGVAGDVIDLRIFQFTLMEIGNWVHADQSTGRVIHIPNAEIFSKPLANSTKGFQYIWNELRVLVTFESNWRKAKEILSQVVEDHALHLSEEAAEQVKRASKKYMIFYSKLTPIVYTSVEDSGVLLTLRYLCPPRRRRSSTQALWEAILGAFHECDDIDFAYPTQRFYDNRQEGKPEAGGPNPS